MLALLLAFLLQSGTEDPDWRIHEEIAGERMKVAAELEKMKQFVWARAEYIKVLRLDPERAEAKAKIKGPAAIPRSNQGKGATLPAKREDLLQSLAAKAAAKYRVKAKALTEEKRELEARMAWRWVLLYAPADPDARRALKLTGKGADALDPAWGEGKWEEMLSKADAGKASADLSHIDRKWGGKNAKRVTENLAIEGVGISAERVTQLARTGECVLAFMRVALGDPTAAPHVKRIVFINGEEAYHRYIDDFVTEKQDAKDRHKATGGFTNFQQREHVMWCHPKGDDWLDVILPHKMAEFMLHTYHATWLHEGTGLFATQLFMNKTGGGCMTLREGTDASTGEWSDPKKADLFLRDKVLAGTDDDIEVMLNATLVTMTSSQLAKSMSLMKFLILRHPQVFRAVVRVYREEVTKPREVLEKALGFTLEELDEFWRRWYLSK
jgi:hypothetical protein